MSETMSSADREQAMIMATIMDLGSVRANHIRTMQSEKHRTADAQALQSSRRTNFAGSQEARWAAQGANAEALTSWNSFANTASPEAGSDDGAAGQSHRARMIENMRISSGRAFPSRGGYSGRGGRGGGFTGRAPVRGGRKSLTGGQEFQKQSSGGKNARGRRTGHRSSTSQDEQLAGVFSTLKLDNHKVELPNPRMSRGKGSDTARGAKAQTKSKRSAQPTVPNVPQSRLVDASSFVESFQKMSGHGAKAKDSPASPIIMAPEKSKSEPLKHKSTSSRDFGKEILGHLGKSVELTKPAAVIPSGGFAPRPETASSSAVESSSVASPSSPSGLGSDPASPSTHGTTRVPLGGRSAHSTIQDIAANVNRYAAITRKAAEQNPRGNAFASSIASPTSSSPEVVGSAAVLASATDKTGFGFVTASSKDISDFTKTAAANVENQPQIKAQKKSNRPVPAGLALLQKAAEIEKLAREISKDHIVAPPSPFTPTRENTPNEVTSELAPSFILTYPLNPALQETFKKTSSGICDSAFSTATSAVPFKVPQKKQQKSNRPVPAGLAFLNMPEENKLNIVEASENRSSVSEMSLEPTMANTSTIMTSGVRGPIPTFAPTVVDTPAKKTVAASKFSAISQSLIKTRKSTTRSARTLGAPGLESSFFHPDRPFDKIWSISPGARPVPAGLKFIEAAYAEYDPQKIAKETSKLPDLSDLELTFKTAPPRPLSLDREKRERRYREPFPMPSPGETYDQVMARLEKEYRGDEDVEMGDDDDEEL